ncbi:MAG: hypothetical protein ACFFCE_10645 [Promethearchaeota archaeon]
MEKEKKILILDNLFNRDYLKLTKRLNKFLNFYINQKLNRLISKLKKTYHEKLDIKIITNRKTIAIKSNNTKIEMLSHFRVKLDHLTFLQILDKLMKENKEMLSKIFNILIESQIFHLKGVFIGDLIELVLLRYLNQVFGEYELIKNIVSSDDYNKTILFNYNPNFLDFFKVLNKRVRNVEVFSDSILILNNSFAVSSHIKYFLNLLSENLKSFWFKKIVTKSSSINKSQENVLITARTKNQIESIKPIYSLLKKNKLINPIIYNRGNLNHFIPLNRFTQLFKFLKLKREIWLGNLASSADYIEYGSIKLTGLIKDFYFDNLFSLLIDIFNDFYLFKQIIKMNKPSVVIITNDYKTDGRLFINYCKKNQIPTIHIPHSAYPIFHQMVTKPNVDFYALECKKDKEYMISKGKSGKNIIITGRPRYEVLFKNQIKKLNEIKDLFSDRTYEFTPDKFTILLATNTLDEISYEKIFMAIISCLKDLDLVENFIIKLHPGENGKIHKQIFNKLGVDPIIVKDYNILDLIYTCNLLLARQSTTILEAMIIGIPTIKLDLVNLDFIKIGSYLFVENDLLINVKNQKELAKNIKNLVKNKDLYNKYSEDLKRTALNYSYYDKNEVPAEKILKLIQKIVFK